MPYEPYAPPSRNERKCMAVSVPSRLTPVLIHIFTGWRPRWIKNTSSRVQVILTGRPVRRDSSQAQILCEKGSLFPPKPPPTLGAMNGIFDRGRPHTFLNSRREYGGVFVDCQQLTLRPARVV